MKHYPCDYNTYFMLKVLNAWLCDAMHRAAKHRRWARKQPQNQFEKPEWTNHDNKLYKELKKIDITREYNNARRPVEIPEEVKPLRIKDWQLKDLFISAVSENLRDWKPF